MTPEQEAKCREAFVDDRFSRGLSVCSNEIDRTYIPAETQREWELWQRAWLAAQPKWLLINDEAKRGQEVFLGGWVNGEWVVMRDDWYVDREMADWREWPAYNDEPPTHYLHCPTPPEQPSGGEASNG